MIIGFGKAKASFLIVCQSPVFLDVAAEEECRDSGHCTFAYCQEEIDVWTLERKGAFSREAFFGGNGKIHLTVFKLLQEHLGEFIFLCEVLSLNLIFCSKISGHLWPIRPEVSST